MQLLLDDGLLSIDEEVVRKSRLLTRLVEEGSAQGEVVPVRGTTLQTAKRWAAGAHRAGTASMQQVFHVIMVRTYFGRFTA